MASLLNRIHPAYRTTRREYWLACAIFCAAVPALIAVAILAGDTSETFLVDPVALLSLLLTCAFICVTIRRLRDAAVSTWWALLFFFPMIFRWPLLQVTVDLPDLTNMARSSLSFDFADFRNLVVFIPILIGLLKRTASIAGQTT
ncbi:MAG: DUF805 domain-containing protein [Sphingomonas sp.]|jgi:uncharacterized membrane protein YhaH (DUF805 family)|uniref:DUF805 domain-containing protein n=1 Tax=Sphingomonas sp. TaxID=28214 RepID=UPI003569FFF5